MENGSSEQGAALRRIRGYPRKLVRFRGVLVAKHHGFLICVPLHLVHRDSFGSELVNFVDKTLVLINSTRRENCRRLLQWLQSLVLRLKERRAERRSLDILSKLSNAELKDIGLSRSDLMSVETGEIFRDISRRKRWHS
ncbi:MAG: DUF1127 domain-containing protein [Proteobacteria bacterium]|nr:DUF1127 domain-containing protein [Pseudomonadota bacterium]